VNGVQLPPRLEWEYRVVAMPADLGALEAGSVDAIACASSVQAVFEDAGRTGFQVVAAGPSYVVLGRVVGVLDAPEPSHLVGVNLGGLPPVPGRG